MDRKTVPPAAGKQVETYLSIRMLRKYRQTSRNSIAYHIGTAILCRMLLNSARRFAYPFAPVLSRGMGVSLTAVTSLIAINQATSVLGVMFGPMADRFGYRRMMIGGMGMLVVGMLTAGFFPTYLVVMAALFLAGLGKSVFDPAVQAYVSERIAYRKRGLAIGFLETSWAASTLVGIPVIALLINRFGWRAPFYALGGFGLVGVVALGSLFIQGNQHYHVSEHSNFWDCVRTGRFAQNDKRKKDKYLEKAAVGDAWRHLIKNRSALGALGYAFLVSIANDNLFVVYGAWLEQSFKISVVTLGIGTGVIGAAELLGEGLTILLADRIGLRRSVSIGLVLTTLSYAAIPLCSQNLLHALAGIFIIFLLFEFMVVSSISLCTEILPEYRATMMSAFFATAGLGRVLGALMGGRLWLAGGIRLTGMVSAFVTLMALLSLAMGFMHRHRH